VASRPGPIFVQIEKLSGNGIVVPASMGESLGGMFTSGPAAASWAPGRLEVFGRGLDNTIYQASYDSGWSGWTSLGGGLTSDPAAVSWEEGRIDVFARGADNAMYHMYYDGTWKL